MELEDIALVLRGRVRNLYQKSERLKDLDWGRHKLFGEGHGYAVIVGAQLSVPVEQPPFICLAGGQLLERVLVKLVKKFIWS